MPILSSEQREQIKQEVFNALGTYDGFYAPQNVEFAGRRGDIQHPHWYVSKRLWNFIVSLPQNLQYGLCKATALHMTGYVPYGYISNHHNVGGRDWGQRSFYIYDINTATLKPVKDPFGALYHTMKHLTHPQSASGAHNGWYDVTNQNTRIGIRSYDGNQSWNGGINDYDGLHNFLRNYLLPDLFCDAVELMAPQPTVATIRKESNYPSCVYLCYNKPFTALDTDTNFNLIDGWLRGKLQSERWLKLKDLAPSVSEYREIVSESVGGVTFDWGTKTYGGSVTRRETVYVYRNFLTNQKVQTEFPP